MADDPLGLTPLTARSVILSTLLGSHPPRLPVRTLVRVGELFGIADGTVRVALSRMVADGDVTTDDGAYRLSRRLVERQNRQDEARHPPTRAWHGRWELAIVDPRPAADVRPALVALHLGELRDGVWARPANLRRAWPAALDETCQRFEGRPDGDPARLARRLWDLPGWATGAAGLMEAMAAATEPARRFTVSAAILRHLRRDPLLPEALLPPTWPGPALRRVYRNYEAELGALLADPEASARHSAR
ncbi:MAG: PaaX family transcriptional regulator C-terminal domain-containing protein [Acidimicrobiales bacterium]